MALFKTAAQLAADLNLPFLEKPQKQGQQVLLVATPERLEMRIVGGPAALRGGRPIAADLSKLDTSSSFGRSLKQPIVKAVGIRRKSDPRPTVIDATAGYGEDAWLLAAMGCHVLAVERNKVVATLLRDAVLRAGTRHPDFLARMRVVQANSIRLLGRIRSHIPGRDKDLPPDVEDFLHADVVFVDPMFPPGRKAAERKPLKVLRWLVGDDQDAEQLLEVALRVARHRVVVKRPNKANPLGGHKPTTTHKGKALRYDVYASTNDD